MEKALKVIAGRYSEAQLMKAQDIIGDLHDELVQINHLYGQKECDMVFNMLTSTINLDA